MCPHAVVGPRISTHSTLPLSAGSHTQGSPRRRDTCDVGLFALAHIVAFCDAVDSSGIH